MSKINLLHVARPASGGIKTHINSLLVNLDRNMFNPILICPESMNMNDVETNYNVLNMNITDKIDIAKDLIIIENIKRILNKYKIHIIHTHGAKAGILGRFAAWRAKTPIIINTVHNFIYETHYSSYLKHFAKIANYRLGLITDYQIAVSNAIKESVIKNENYSEKHIKTIYNGIDFNKYFYSLEENYLNSKCNYNISPPIIAVIARLIPAKGIDIFLKSAQILLEEMPEINVLIVGDGPLRAKLEIEAEKTIGKDKIKFLGYVEDIHSLLPHFNVVVIPSLSEGLSIAAIEAMAARCPIVAFNVGGLPEVVKHNVTGILIEKGDYKSLAYGIKKLIIDKKLSKKFGCNARNVVEKYFTLSNMVNETEGIYKKLIFEKIGY